jgi:hypothetical protein
LDGHQSDRFRTSEVPADDEIDPDLRTVTQPGANAIALHFFGLHRHAEADLHHPADALVQRSLDVATQEVELSVADQPIAPLPVDDESFPPCRSHVHKPPRHVARSPFRASRDAVD